MSFVHKLLMPKKIMFAGWVMIATLIAACVAQYQGYETIGFVRTVFYYLLLDYVWVSVRRELFET